MQLEKYIHIESDAVPLDFCDEIVKEYDDDEYERGTINDYERSRYRAVSYTHLTLPTNREV